MKIRKDLLGAVGLNEYAPVKSLVVVILFLAAIGIFADSIVDMIEKQDFLKFFVSLVLFGVVYLLYYYLGKQELKIVKELSTDKGVMLLVTPSNANHLEKIIGQHKLKSIHIFKEKAFPKVEEYALIKALLIEKKIELHEYIVESLENPREIQSKFNEALSQVENLNDATLNISTGKASTSIILFELARFKAISVEYLSSAYSHENKPIEGTAYNYNIDFYREFLG